MILRLLGALVATATLLPVPAGADGRLRSDVERVNVIGDPVSIVLVNSSDEVITMGDTWTIESVRRGQEVATYCWLRSDRKLAPGERRVWTWDQREDSYGYCAQSHAGAQVSPGPYRVTFGGLDIARRIHVGQLFQVGFDHLAEEETFTVFVNRANDIEQMTAEAESEEKTLMVTGIVRDARRYNSRWNFTMGPGSIVPAEVSIEVCDADPYYVQDHKRQWMGDRWCPWSSYVAAVGR
jgi:hypothetical protein